MDPKDRLLADILRQDETPQVDPAFRLAVLERRARQIFHRRLIVALLAALALSAALVIAILASASSTEIGSLLIVGAALVVSWRLYAPVLADWIHRALSISKEG